MCNKNPQIRVSFIKSDCCMIFFPKYYSWKLWKTNLTLSAKLVYICYAKSNTLELDTVKIELFFYKFSSQQ